MPEILGQWQREQRAGKERQRMDWLNREGERKKVGERKARRDGMGEWRVPMTEGKTVGW